MFNQEANATDNNAAFSSDSFAPMTTSYERLIEATVRLHPNEVARQPASVARFFNISQQRLKHWEKRGLPKSEITNLARQIGCNADWLELGTGPMTGTGNPSQAALATETHHPYGNIPSTVDETAQNVGKPRFYDEANQTSMRHHLPIITAEQIMDGILHDREENEFMATASIDSCYAGPASRLAFLFEAEDDNMAGGDMHINKGYLVMIEPEAEPEPEDVVLVRIGARRPILRRLTEGGEALYLVAEQGRLDPVRYDSATCNILGVALTAYPKPRVRRLKNTPQ